MHPERASHQREVVCFGLGNAVQAPREVLSDADFYELIGWALRERLIGQLRHASRSLFELTPTQEQTLASEFRMSVGRSMLVESAVPAVATSLDAAHIDWRVLKGVATARLLYPDTTWRTFGDLDLLVRPQDIDKALAALAPLTSVPAPVQAGPARSRAVKERQITDTHGVDLDVHFAVEGSLLSSRLPIDALLASPQTLDVNGVNIRTLSHEALFVHAVLHVSSHGVRMSTLPDVARLATRVLPTSGLFLQLVGSRSVRNLFVWSLSSASRRVPLPPEWMSFCAAHQPGLIKGRTLDWIQRRPERMRLANAVTGGERLRRMSESMWPSRDFLAQLSLSRTQNLGRIFRVGRVAARGR